MPCAPASAATLVVLSSPAALKGRGPACGVLACVAAGRFKWRSPRDCAAAMNSSNERELDASLSALVQNAFSSLNVRSMPWLFNSVPFNSV